MKRARSIAIVATAVALPLTGCADKPIDTGQPKVVHGLALAPYAQHEECVDLAAGDRLDYRFTSSEPLAFNIHYHDGNAIVMPVSRDSVSSDAGIFAPRIAQGYCLMWEAGGSGAALDYRALVRRVRP